MRALVLLFAAALLTGCGTADDREQARHAAERFYAAVRAHDGTAACAVLSQDAAKALKPCPRAVTRLGLRGGRVVRTRVYITNAMVELAGGDAVFLGREPGGWKVSAAGCRGVTRDRPGDCEVGA
jgi:uncharacterized protein YceK